MKHESRNPVVQFKEMVKPCGSLWRKSKTRRGSGTLTGLLPETVPKLGGLQR